MSELPRGELVAIAPARGVGLGVAYRDRSFGVACAEPGVLVRELETRLRPRAVIWSQASAALLLAGGVRLSTAWDLAAVGRILDGGWRGDPGTLWARAHGLEPPGDAVERQPDLFGEHGGEDPEEALAADGNLSVRWRAGAWAASAAHLATWARLGLELAHAQRRRLIAERGEHSLQLAYAESAAELLCAELAANGLPVDRRRAEALVAEAVGPRAADAEGAARQRASRDEAVLRLAPKGPPIDLRSPGQVRTLLRRAGIDVPDTRAGRLREVAALHPVVPALLAWRKAERIATTYGYAWLDEHVGADDRLRGEWSAADGAAGRMTASSGLHNLPGELREAVAAEPGHRFVRADLGQIEPRVLAAISGDEALGRAALADDLYLPIADELGVEREQAKLAVLGAMYGQTTGRGAATLERLRSTYPVAIAYLERAARAGRSGTLLTTHGGRRVVISPPAGTPGSEVQRRNAAAQGRYARNALVQGAAAELFKLWAVIVRARLVGGPASIVLCLHDELLVHVPESLAGDVTATLTSSLEEAARRFRPVTPVRFTVEITVVSRWSEAKAGGAGFVPGSEVV